MKPHALIRGLLLLAFCAPAAAGAQTIGTLDLKPLPALVHPSDPKLPAKELFGRATMPSAQPARVYGSYAKGCIAGAVELPISGPDWQVMRLSRNRNWGHPALIRVIERIAVLGAKAGWPGLLIGDVAQPRGGPMLSGHASHEVGLDVDIWLTPMPHHVLTARERETMSADNVVAASRKDVNHKLWNPAYMAILKIAAEQPEVQRIFVNAAIKKELCHDAGKDRAWLAKMRAWWGHDDHFHMRIKCPSGSPGCKPQEPPPAGDGCGKELSWWFSDAVLHPKPSKKPEKPKPPVTLADLPSACRQVLRAPSLQTAEKLPDGYITAGTR
jgi:penicillin-insensitive murein DD-endopeptidase